MSPSNPVSELVILQLQPGVDLEPLYAGRTVEPGTPAYDVVKLTNTMKAQQGFLRQFWGTQVENPNIFVWSIDWESFEHHAAFINSPGYADFMATAAQVWDFAAAAPVMLHTAFTSDATAAREAPMTEVAFFMVSKDAGEEKKTQMEDVCMPLLKSASEVGKCKAFAVGWAFEDQKHTEASNGVASTFNVLIGWSSVEERNNFAATSEFQELVAPLGANMLPPLPGWGLFCVNFQAVA